MGHVPHRVLQDLRPVGALHQRVELGADFALAGRGDFVVEHFHFNALRFQREGHGIADVLQRIHRRHGEITALDRRTMAHVAAFVVDAGGPGGFFGLDLHEAAGHVDVPGDAVENEELGFRAEVGGVAQAAGLEVGLGALGEGARIAIVALHVRRLEHVATDVQHGLVGEGIQAHAVRIRHEQHVGSLDAFPAGDGGTIEGMAIGKLLGRELVVRNLHMLFLAPGVGKTKVDELDLLFLDEIQYVVG